MTDSELWREKQRLRRWARGVRAGLATPDLSARAVTHLSAWPAFVQAQRVLVYLAFGDELELTSVTTAKEKTFYATRTEAEGRLTVHGLSGGLEPHPYGFLQPTDSSVVDPHALELVLVPGLAFDVRGTRLGYGKGFYDRLLPQLRAGVPRVGVVPDALIVEALPRAAHDVPMTHLLSETGLRVLSPAHSS